MAHSQQWITVDCVGDILGHKEPLVLCVLHLVLAPSLASFLCGMVFTSALVIITQLPVILNFVLFYTRTSGFQRACNYKMEALVPHLYTGGSTLYRHFWKWAHPCFHVAWTFYLRVWYMQFRPQTMVSEKHCFESEGSGNLDRKHE